MNKYLVNIYRDSFLGGFSRSTSTGDTVRIIARGDAPPIRWYNEDSVECSSLQRFPRKGVSNSRKSSMVDNWPLGNASNKRHFLFDPLSSHFYRFFVSYSPRILPLLTQWMEKKWKTSLDTPSRPGSWSVTMENG